MHWNDREIKCREKIHGTRINFLKQQRGSQSWENEPIKKTDADIARKETDAETHP